MLDARYIVRQGEHIVRLDRYHLTEIHFPIIIKMPNQIYSKRKWWQFWEPKWIVEDAQSFYDSKSRVAHLTETDYSIYKDAAAKRSNNPNGD